jgi:Uma2 family endonuclease
VKARRYAELGVEHYWITDPETHRLECHRLIDGAFRMIRAAEGDAVLSHPDFPGLEIDLAKLWQ